LKASGRNSRSALLAPFQVRDFRCQFPADMLTSWGIEMEVLILGWYILTETGSVLLLTIFSSLQYSGTLIAPMFGMAGDRFGHRNVLCAMRLCYAVLAASLMVLAFTGAMRPLYVMLIASVNGLIRPSDLAMRQALVADIVPNEQLMAAIGVARTTADSARIFGSLAGASLVAALGIGPAYMAVTIFYGSGLVLTTMISRKPPGSPVSKRGGLAFLREVWEGVTYVRHRPLEMAGIWVAFLVNLLAFPMTIGLMPYVAKEIYHMDQTGLSTLIASFAIGACVGSLMIGFLGRSLRPARMMLIFAAMWFALMLIFVQVPNPAAGRITLVLAGFAQSLSLVPLSTMLLKSAGPKFRGRVMGVRMLAIYGLPIGLVIAGTLIPWIGYRATASSYCIVGLACMALIGLHWRDVIWPLDAIGNQR
jgi:predicted MFS family arabinose efflux permease